MNKIHPGNKWWHTYTCCARFVVENKCHRFLHVMSTLTSIIIIINKNIIHFILLYILYFYTRYIIILLQKTILHKSCWLLLLYFKVIFMIHRPFSLCRKEQLRRLILFHKINKSIKKQSASHSWCLTWQPSQIFPRPLSQSNPWCSGESRSDLNKYDSAESEIKRRSQPQLKVFVCVNLC